MSEDKKKKSSSGCGDIAGILLAAFIAVVVLFALRLLGVV